jgi:hypothetical protein
MRGSIVGIGVGLFPVGNCGWFHEGWIITKVKTFSFTSSELLLTQAPRRCVHMTANSHHQTCKFISRAAAGLPAERWHFREKHSEKKDRKVIRSASILNASQGATKFPECHLDPSVSLCLRGEQADAVKSALT